MVWYVNQHKNVFFIYLPWSSGPDSQAKGFWDNFFDDLFRVYATIYWRKAARPFFQDLNSDSNLPKIILLFVWLKVL